MKDKRHLLDEILAHHKLFKCSHENTKLCRGKRGDVGKPATNIVFTKHPEDVIAQEGSQALMDCQFQVTDEQLRPTIKWRKDGLIVRHAGKENEGEVLDNIYAKEHARVHINKENASLIINSVIPNDAGSYDCMIVNHDGTEATSKVAVLSVIAKLKFAPKPTSKVLELNSTGKIHCKAQGSPLPTIKWVKGADMALPQEATVENGTLVFDKVKFENKGNYTCIASSSQGEIRATVTVSVAVAPQFLLKPPDTITVSEMREIALHCQPSGDPMPTIQWDKDLNRLHSNDSENDRFEILENGTLIIKEAHLEDEGKFGCTIGNMAGFKREEFQLNVRPSYLPVSDISDDGFVITKAVLITMGIAATYIILVVFLMIWCRRRRQSRKLKLGSDMKDNGELEGEIKTAETEPCLPVEKELKLNQNGVAKKSNSKGKGNEQEKSDDTVNSNKSKKSTTSVLDVYSIPRSALLDLISIGKGEFGEVLIGKAKRSDLKTSTNLNKDENNQSIIAEAGIENEKKNSKDGLNEIKEDKEEYRYVMVKSLTKIKDEHACSEFRRQIDLFRTVSSRGVSRLYGLCREKDPHYMVLEYTDWVSIF